MSDERLLPCPFCGPQTEHDDQPLTHGFDALEIPGEPKGRWDVFCLRCGASTDEYETEAEAIAAWNTRAPCVEQ